MLQFDKIKIVTSLEYIEIIDEDAFERKEQCGELLSLHYKKTVPFQLYIKVNYEDDELVIEFTGKLVGKHYQKLISLETIDEYFETINKIGICTLDIDGIVHNAEVVSCDVTRDVDCENIPRMTKFINGNVKNRNRYVCRAKVNGNFIIEKNVDSPAYKRRLTIYDKYREMNLTKNRQFRKMFDIPDDEFKDKCRLEMNLTSKEQIRAALRIEDTDLMTVLSASADPITEFLDEVLADTPESSVKLTNRKEYYASLVLRDCNYNLEAVEAKLRYYAGDKRGYHPQRDMAIFRELMNRGISDDSYTKEKILDLARGVSN